MALLVDTSVIIAMERRRADLRSVLDELGSESVALATISASELLHGVHRADTALRRGRREAFVEGILSLIPVIPMDLSVARTHARLWADLRSRSIVVGAHDLIIAAMALTHQLTVLTDNVREFGSVEGLVVRRFSTTNP